MRAIEGYIFTRWQCKETLEVRVLLARQLFEEKWSVRTLEEGLSPPSDIALLRGVVALKPFHQDRCDKVSLISQYRHFHLYLTRKFSSASLCSVLLSSSRTICPNSSWLSYTFYFVLASWRTDILLQDIQSNGTNLTSTRILQLLPSLRGLNLVFDCFVGGLKVTN